MKKITAIVLTITMLMFWQPIKESVLAKPADEAMGVPEITSMFYFPEEEYAILKVENNPSDFMYQFYVDASYKGLTKSKKSRPRNYKSEGFIYDLNSYSPYMGAEAELMIRYYEDKDSYGEWSSPVHMTLLEDSGIQVVEDVELTASDKEQTYRINAASEYELDYVSESDEVLVNSYGKVTIPAGYHGTASIILSNLNAGQRISSRHVYITVTEGGTHEHRYKSKVTKTAGCETRGIRTYTCDGCKDSYTEYIKETGHVYMDGRCLRCGEKDDSYIPPEIVPDHLNQPKSVKIKVAKKGLTLSWGKVKDADGYYIYRKAPTSNVFMRYGFTDAPTKTTFTDTNVENGKKYAYMVAAKAGSSVVSEKSAEKSYIYLTAPTLSSVKADGKNALKATVKKKNSKATGYKYEYATDSKFSKVTTVTISKNSTLKATIKKLKSKKTYYVRVRAYKKSGKTTYYSVYSGKKSAKTK